MTNRFAAAMRSAASLTRAGNLTEATRLIQNALSGANPDSASQARDPGPGAANAPRISGPDVIDGEAVEVKTAGRAPGAATGETSRPEARSNPGRARRPLGEVLRTLGAGRPGAGFGAGFGAGMPGGPMKAPPVVTVPEGAKWLTRSHDSPAGSRQYRLYVPAAVDKPRGLVVMLHGCKQNPDDFAVGTKMNALAETNGLLVAYPAQVAAANPSSCWNWFSPADQRRGAGEPAILAGITRALMEEYGLERDQVFIAGLSAGGAMAAVMAEAYPELYAAAGIHSGLPYASAEDVVTAFAAMRGDATVARPRRPDPTHDVRLIVFHGSADRTVHPSNSERIVAGARRDGPHAPRTNSGRSQQGRAFKRTVEWNADGLARVEHWQIQGAGHAWSGGHQDGSYTDPKGPEASAEMVRFFLQPDLVGKPAG